MFERVYCISLARRSDRYAEFLERLPKPWPFVGIEKFNAIDGTLTPPPSWWKVGPGAWGCYRSHLAILESCINEGVKSVLILEDDCQFVDDFLERWELESSQLPEWDMLYLGGQLLKAQITPVRRLNDLFIAPHNVNRTHAYALRGQEAMKVVYHHLLEQNWNVRHHIDHRYGVLHESRKIKVVSPVQWYCKQAAGKSDINGKEQGERSWTPPDHVLGKAELKTKPLVLIVGLHRSGSSCIAGVHHHLGVHMGHKFVGCEMNGGHEAMGIARLCEQAMPYPDTDILMDADLFRQKFSEWYLTQNRTTTKRIIGAKYPHLCVFASWLIEQYKGNVKLVHCERSLEKSIASLIRRDGKRIPHDTLAAVQKFLWQQKRFLLQEHEAHTIEYEKLIADPKTEIEKLAGYLDLPYSETAAAYVNPEKMHIK